MRGAGGGPRPPGPTWALPGAPAAGPLAQRLLPPPRPPAAVSSGQAGPSPAPAPGLPAGTRGGGGRASGGRPLRPARSGPGCRRGDGGARQAAGGARRAAGGRKAPEGSGSGSGLRLVGPAAPSSVSRGGSVLRAGLRRGGWRSATMRWPRDTGSRRQRGVRGARESCRRYSGDFVLCPWNFGRCASWAVFWRGSPVCPSAEFVVGWSFYHLRLMLVIALGFVVPFDTEI